MLQVQAPPPFRHGVLSSRRFLLRFPSLASDYFATCPCIGIALSIFAWLLSQQPPSGARRRRAIPRRATRAERPTRAPTMRALATTRPATTPARNGRAASVPRARRWMASARVSRIVRRTRCAFRASSVPCPRSPFLCSVRRGATVDVIGVASRPMTARRARTAFRSSCRSAWTLGISKESAARLTAGASRLLATLVHATRVVAGDNRSADCLSPARRRGLSWLRLGVSLRALYNPRARGRRPDALPSGPHVRFTPRARGRRPDRRRSPA